jgi:hypothetical protein
MFRRLAEMSYPLRVKRRVALPSRMAMTLKPSCLISKEPIAAVKRLADALDDLQWELVGP